MRIYVEAGNALHLHTLEGRQLNWAKRSTKRTPLDSGMNENLDTPRSPEMKNSKVAVGVREPRFRLVHATTFTTGLGTRAKIRQCRREKATRKQGNDERAWSIKNYSYNRKCGQGSFGVASANSQTMNVHAISEDVLRTSRIIASVRLRRLQFVPDWFSLWKHWLRY